MPHQVNEENKKVDKYVGPIEPEKKTPQTPNENTKEKGQRTSQPIDQYQHSGKDEDSVRQSV